MTFYLWMLLKSFWAAIWLYDRDVKHFGRDNTYEFVHNGKPIRLLPAKPLDPLERPPPKPKLTYATSTNNRIQLLSHKDFEREAHNTGLMFALVTKACSQPTSESTSDHPLAVTLLLEEFIESHQMTYPMSSLPFTIFNVQLIWCRDHNYQSSSL